MIQLYYETPELLLSLIFSLQVVHPDPTQSSEARSSVKGSGIMTQLEI